MIEFFVPGIPVAFARTGGGKTANRFTPPKQRAEMAAIKIFGQAAMKNAPPIDGAVFLNLRVLYPWPATWSQRKRARLGPWKTSKPDADNHAKLVSDSLNGVVWVDDARVAQLLVSKMYDENPGLRITVTPLE